MLLEEFFERKKTWEYVIYNMLAFIFIGISMLIWIMPYQVWQAEDEPVFWILFGFMEVIGLDCYLQKFTTYKDNGQIKQIDELMKYRQIQAEKAGKNMCVAYLYIHGLSNCLCDYIPAHIFNREHSCPFGV